MGAFRRHSRFLLAFALGLAVWFGTSVLTLEPVLRVLIAANCLFVVYLGLMFHLTLTTTAADLRRHAEADDEGAALILMLAVASVAVSITSIFLVLNRTPDSLAEALFALSAAPLGWALIHMLFAYRYAHLYYAPTPDAGLQFPSVTDQSPGAWDFLYFSFTIGMTAQVSDVQVTSVQMRKVVLFHAVGSFFFNTVILALAVNAGLALSR